MIEPFVAMCISRDGRSIPTTALTLSTVAQKLARPFAWSEFTGLGITIYLNLGVRQTAKRLGKREFWAFFVTDDIFLPLSTAEKLAFEVERAELKGYDFMLPVPILPDGSSNITTLEKRRLNMKEVANLPDYAVYGKDYIGGAIAAYYGRFSADYTFHEDDQGRDESYYFIHDNKKEPRLIKGIPVMQLKNVMVGAPVS